MRSQLLGMVSSVAVMINKTRKRLCNFSCNKTLKAPSLSHVGLIILYVRTSSRSLSLKCAGLCSAYTAVEFFEENPLQEGRPSHNLNTLCFDGHPEPILLRLP